MKTRITLIILSVLCIVFVYFLSTYFFIEEVLALYFFPYILFALPVGVYGLIKLLFKKKETFRSVLFKLAIPSSIVHIVLIILISSLAAPRYITNQEAIHDLEFMVQTLEDVHPNLYEYASKEKFHSDVEKLKNMMPENISTRKFYKELCRLTAQLHDGHTGPSLENLASTGIVFEKKYFPYKTKIINDRIFVSKNYSYNNKIPVGSEIVTLNGISSKNVIEEVSGLIRYESIAYRNYQFSLPIYISMWNDYGDYSIEYREPENEILHTITTSGGVYTKMQFNAEMMKGHTEPYYKFSVLPGNIGYLEFYQFYNLDKFKTFLQTTFRQIQDDTITNLIIDIRSNGGGNSALGDELLQYLSPVPFRQYAKTLIKVSHEIQLHEHGKWTKNYIPDTVIEAGDTVLIPLRGNPLRFTGNCFLLTGGATFSSASDFASRFRCFGSGKIVGSETGGVTVCYGDVYDFRLPSSEIIMEVSWKKFYNACSNDNKNGVIPDYIVENSFEDEEKNNDRVLQYTIGLIANSIRK